MCANNLAAAADAKRTMDRLMDPADVSTLFELWAVSREHRKTKKNKLLQMQQEATLIVSTGLYIILGVTKCAMNYENYIPKLVQGKGMGLVNWPNGVEFKRMLLQSAASLMQILLDSLKSGVTCWKVLTTAEKKKLTDQYNEMVERGEVKVKRAPIVEDNEEDKGEGEEEDEGNDEEGEEAYKQRTGNKSKPAPATGKSKTVVKLKPAPPAAKLKAATKPNPPTKLKLKPATNTMAKPMCSTCEEGENNDNDDPPPQKKKPAPKSKPIFPVFLVVMGAFQTFNWADGQPACLWNTIYL
ncbi:hypothetical protein C8R45DRAFT_947632 [Mycena sanguinolenta]|nr:hypothetical protein C8R45DRAFT_947632 [Mycena sanguinolenta]